MAKKIKTTNGWIAYMLNEKEILKLIVGVEPQL